MNKIIYTHPFRIATIALLVLSLAFPAHAFWGISPKPAASVIATFLKHQKALPDDEIIKLSNIAKQPGGTKVVGKELGKLNLSKDTLEDTYMRIVVNQSTISREEAEGMFSRLRGTPGFRSTLSKIIGASDVKTSGHLYELRIADKATQYGFKAKGIGIQFDDGIKQGVTDVDVLLEIKGKPIAIEAKDYLSTTPIPLIKFRSDFISLSQYAKQHLPSKVITVFSISNKPNDALSLRSLEHEAQKNGVQLIFGNPEQQIIQIKQLQEIL
jgi:hypothetical protein